METGKGSRASSAGSFRPSAEDIDKWMGRAFDMVNTQESGNVAVSCFSVSLLHAHLFLSKFVVYSVNWQVQVRAAAV